MNPSKLIPHDLADFLRARKRLEYDAASCQAGKVVLTSLGKLSVADIYVNSEESPLQDSDPKAGIKGYYSVPAVSLIAKCQHYDPDGILIWLPEESAYGTWDNDHWDVLIFPKVTWSDIAKNPLPFINAQWEHGTEFEYLAPWGKYKFKKGMPW